MNMTRREFLMNPLRGARMDVEHAGAWLRRATSGLSALRRTDADEGTAKAGGPSGEARGLGLREARAQLGRNEHE